MKIYNYDTVTGEYTGSQYAQPNPKREGEFLYPPNATTIVPPTLKENEVVIFRNDKWEIIPDFRGEKIINIKTKNISEMCEYGAIQEDWMLLSEYEKTDMYQQDLIAQERQQEIDDILGKINELDLKRIRAICEPSVKDAETGETWLDYYNSKIIKLREDLEVI